MVNQDQLMIYIQNVGMKIFGKKKNNYGIQREHEEEDNQEYLNSI